MASHSRDQATTCRVDISLARGVQTNFPSVCASTQANSLEGSWGTDGNGALFTSALRLIDDAKDLVHRHLDSDLDRMEAGSEVDFERSVDEMLQAVQDLAQKALDEHGDVLLGIPFGMMARDYLKTREVATDL